MLLESNMAAASDTGAADEDEAAVEARWRATCTVPDHPDRCPACASRVRIYHINLENEALFMCSNHHCDWPMDSLPVERYLGVSDYRLYNKLKTLRKRRAKRKAPENGDGSDGGGEDEGQPEPRRPRLEGPENTQDLGKMDHGEEKPSEEPPPGPSQGQQESELQPSSPLAEAQEDATGAPKSAPPPVSPPPAASPDASETPSVAAAGMSVGNEDDSAGIKDQLEASSSSGEAGDAAAAAKDDVGAAGAALAAGDARDDSGHGDEEDPCDDDDDADDHAAELDAVFRFSRLTTRMLSPMPSSPARSLTPSCPSPAPSLRHTLFGSPVPSPAPPPAPSPKPPPAEAKEADDTEMDSGDAPGDPDPPEFLRPAASPWSSSRADPASPWTPRAGPDASPAPSLSPWSARTPFHVPHLLSPFPPTPGKYQRDEFSDSELSDASMTPRSTSRLEEPQQPPALPTPPRSVPVISLKKTSKDSWGLNTSSASSPEPGGKSPPPSPMKMVLKRKPQQDWNVEENQVNKSSKKADGGGAGNRTLDKVVLSLKKTATGGGWNVKSPEEVGGDSAGAPAAAAASNSDEAGPSASESKPKKRSRKSKVMAPVKMIPPSGNARRDSLQEDSDGVTKKVEEPPAGEDNTDIELPSKPAPAPAEVPVPEAAPESSNVEEKEGGDQGPAEIARPKTLKTFSRKKKAPAPVMAPVPESAVRLHSLSNRISMGTGLPIQISVGGTDGAGTKPGAEAKDDKLGLGFSSKPAEPGASRFRVLQDIANKIPTDDNPEFASLMKAMGVSDAVNPDFVQKVQQSLGLPAGGEDSSRRAQRMTVHVGENKGSIDLPVPSQTLDVTRRGDSVTVLLSSESDGIEGEALRAHSPPPDPSTSYRRRRPGRPKRTRSPSPPPTMVLPPPAVADQNLPYRFNPPAPAEGNFLPNQQLFLLQEPAQQPQQQQHQQLQQQQDYYDPRYPPQEPPHREVFWQQIEEWMQNYQPPANMQQYHPVISMLLVKSFTPLERGGIENVNQWLMLLQQHYTYNSQLAQHRQFLEEQQRQQQQQQLQQQRENRTYAELQTVRGQDNANDVLRRQQLTEHQQHQQHLQQQQVHQQQQSHPQDQQQPRQEQEAPEGQQASDSSSPAEAARDTASAAGTPRTRVKEEVFELPSTPGCDLSSVAPTSVIAAPRSVSVIPAHMPACGKVGRGSKAVTFTIPEGDGGGSNGGTSILLHVETDTEAKALVALVREKVAEKEHRGKPLSEAPQYFSAARRARSILPADVVAYVDKVFTKRGLAECVPGRKKKNYPKRSQIIKVDKATGKLIYPKSRAANAAAAEVESRRAVKKEPAAEEEQEGAGEGAWVAAEAAGNGESSDSSQPPLIDHAENIARILSNADRFNGAAEETPDGGAAEQQPGGEEEEEEEDRIRTRGATAAARSLIKEQETLKISPKLFVSRKKAQVTAEAPASSKSPKKQPTSPAKPVKVSAYSKDGKVYKGFKPRSDQPEAEDKSGKSKGQPHFSQQDLRDKLAAVAARSAGNSRRNSVEDGGNASPAPRQGASVQNHLDKLTQSIDVAGLNSEAVAPRAAKKSKAGGGVGSPSAAGTASPRAAAAPEEAGPIDPDRTTMTRKRTQRLESQDAPFISFSTALTTIPGIETAGVRKSQADRLQKLLAKKEQKQKLLQKKEEKKKMLQKKAGGAGRYKGFVPRAAREAEAAAKPAAAKRVSKFKEAAVINGVRKVLKPNGEVVEVPVERLRPVQCPPPGAKLVPVPQPQLQPQQQQQQQPLQQPQPTQQQEESDAFKFLEELFKVADEVEEHQQRHQQDHSFGQQQQQQQQHNSRRRDLALAEEGQLSLEDIF